MLSQLRTSEGVVYGEGHNLPTAESLDQYTDNIVALGNMAGVVIDGPDDSSVLRLHYTPGFADPEDCARQAESGIAHYDRLKACGLQIPAQRLLMAPSPLHAERERLYGFTERLKGRNLQGVPAEAQESSMVISGLAQYLLHTYDNGQPTGEPYLFDLYKPQQYTTVEATTAPAVVLHDVGLEFAPSAEDAGEAHWRAGVKVAVMQLATWTQRVAIEAPESLREMSGLTGVDWTKDHLSSHDF